MSKNKCHFCDYCDNYCDVIFKEREESFDYKDENIIITERYAVCKECGHEVYNEDLGNETLRKLSRKYYEIKHGMTIDDFKEIRWNYNLSQVLFAKVLNWGSSTVKRYEIGNSLPNKTHIPIYKMLKNNPENIINFYEENKESLNEKEIKKVEEALKKYLDINRTEKKVFDLLNDIYNYKEKTIFNGFSSFDPIKLFNMILYFGEFEVLKTKLMKLLWYADFLMFKNKEKAISGISYVHFPYGPVPKNHDLMLGTMEGINAIKIIEEEAYNGYIKIIIESQEKIKEDIFDNEELSILKYVNDYFKDFGSKEIADFSHEEEGWIKTDNYQNISYEFAKNLKI